MGSLTLNGTVSGQVTLAAPSVAGTTTITLPTITGGSFIVSDASGNVGIGTASPNKKLSIISGGSTQFTVSTAAGANDLIQFDTYNGSAVKGIYTWSQQGSEVMRIDSSGNVGIGTTGPVGKVDSVSNAYAAFVARSSSSGVGTSVVALRTTDSGAANFSNAQYDALSHQFQTQGAERMRIDSGGNLLVGQTSTNAAALGASLSTNDGTNQWRLSVGNAASTNAGFGLSVYSTGAAAYRFYVGMAGTIFATSTTISAISDKRFKENIRDLDTGLDAVMALKPRLYDWKQGKGADVKNARGFIAQEFEQVFPDLIDEWADPAPEGEEPYKSVRQDLIPVLVKAIQELKAELDALKGTK